MSMQFLHSLKNTGSLGSYLTYVNSLQVLNEEQERMLISDYQKNNNLEAAHQVILLHLRFVTHIAKKYTGYGLPFEDLIQEGTVGLMKSVKRFKLDFGVRLSSYAVYYIKAEIQEFILRNWRLVKSVTTKTKRKLFYNLKKLKARTEWLNDKERMDITNQLRVSEKDIVDMEIQLSQSDVYLDDPINYKEKGSASSTSSIGSLFEDKSEPFSIKLIHEDFKKKLLGEIRKVIDTLDDRSKDIIVNRWLSKERYSHKYFSEQYGVSSERIRQIEKKAILKIRKKMFTLIETSK
jgi:RNA polymerase sigma-32 factor